MVPCQVWPVRRCAGVHIRSPSVRHTACLIPPTQITPADHEAQAWREQRRNGRIINAFDFVMMLVVAAAAGAGMMGNVSLMDATLVLVTLTGWNIITTTMKRNWVWFDRVIDGAPIVLVEDGRILRDRLDKTRIAGQTVVAESTGGRVVRLAEVVHDVLAAAPGGFGIGAHHREPARLVSAPPLLRFE